MIQSEHQKVFWLTNGRIIVKLRESVSLTVLKLLKIGHTASMIDVRLKYLSRGNALAQTGATHFHAQLGLFRKNCAI